MVARAWEWRNLRQMAARSLEAVETLGGVRGRYGRTRFRVTIWRGGRYHYTIEGGDGCHYTGSVDATDEGLRELRGIIHDAEQRCAP